MAPTVALVAGSFAVGLVLSLSLVASTSSMLAGRSLLSSSDSPASEASSVEGRIEMTRSTISRSSFLDDDDDDAKFEQDCSFISHHELEATLRFVVCGGGKKKACPRDFPAPLYLEGLPGDNTVGVDYPENGGFGLNVWATVVNRAGRVCAVAASGPKFDSAWTYARVHSAIKASTANGFSTDKLAMASGNLYSMVAGPAAGSGGGAMFGLHEALAVDAGTAYAGSVDNWGESCSGNHEDPLCGARIGGVSVAGGGLALYNKHGKKLGALGVAGDCPCTDHIIAWKVRFLLEFDHVTAGVGIAQQWAHDGSGKKQVAADNLVLENLEILNGLEKAVEIGYEAFEHPTCDVVSTEIITFTSAAGSAALPQVRRLHPAEDDDDDHHRY